MNMYEVRTDLALESGERFKQNHVEIHGVVIEESKKADSDIKTTIVKIETENGAAAMGKPQGNYITIEAPNLSEPDEEYHEKVAKEVAKHLKQLYSFQKEQTVLVVGLGNGKATPDALGPWAVEHVHVTRHIMMDFGLNLPDDTYFCKVSALVPGVMPNTGMETFEIIKGVVEEVKPDVVIAIDALAARGVRRLGRTIQMTDAGVHPGSGVGNHRQGLNKKSLGIPVIGIGVPTVVDAATIVHDAVEHLLAALEDYEQQEFLDEMITPNLRSMYVTPKDVDETVAMLSKTVALGINMVLDNSRLERV